MIFASDLCNVICNNTNLDAYEVQPQGFGLKNNFFSFLTIIMELLPELSQNLLEILDDDEYYDIEIEVGNGPYVKVFRAHMVILNYRSPYLRRILSTNKKKNDGALVKIKLSNILPKIFQIILR
jgi:hypothetical protein